MGYDLSGDVHLSRANWSLCLFLAQAFGWVPEGTEPPNVVWYGEDGEEALRYVVPPEKWDGNYFTNDLQKVRASDAAALSAAIHRAVDALDHRPVGLTSQQADALNNWEGHRPWLENMARYFADRAEKQGFEIR